MQQKDAISKMSQGLGQSIIIPGVDHGRSMSTCPCVIQGGEYGVKNWVVRVGSDPHNGARIDPQRVDLGQEHGSPGPPPSSCAPGSLTCVYPQVDL